ncbi:MAG: DUF6266 family protein [Bacteroidales bacterium]|nr:DUF6266 family protein [Bacteroidales bacterium]
MAKQMGGFLGPVVGKLGPAVGYLWRGRPVFRAYVRHIHYPNTKRQQFERDWFITMVRFAAVVRPAILRGLREVSLQAGMTEGNYFVLRNKPCFRRNDDCVKVDYARLSLAEGPVAPVTPTSVTIDDEGVLRVEFGRNGGMNRARSADNVHLYVYNATLGRGLLAAPVCRRDGCIALCLPDNWSSHDLHCYLFATDAHGFASSTAYANPVTIQDCYCTETEETTDAVVPLLDDVIDNPQPDVSLLTTQATANSYPRGKPCLAG